MMLMMISGYKFETLSLIPNTWAETPRDVIENREDEIVNNHAQYCSIVKTGIGKAKLIIGGEVDAGKSLSCNGTHKPLSTTVTKLTAYPVWDSKPPNKNDAINWVELKTSATISNDRDMLKYERKLLKFWIQSFLLGVPKIIVGFRSKDGILERLEELETSSIPGTVKSKGKASWDGNTCISFAAAFLDCRSLRFPVFGQLWERKKGVS